MRHQPDRPRRIRSGAWALSAAALALAGALGLLGFLAFAAFATRAPPADSPLADGIVVLTGGEQRIFEAARLLEQGKGQRLLVSGVFRHTSEAALRKLTELPRSRFACCVDIGRDALDTIGNAAETDAWVRQHGFRSIIVVTASYHMPRSLLELGRAMPDVVLHPHPVLPQQFREAPWWLQAASTKLLISEYIKLLPTVLRYATRTAARAFAVAPAQDPPAASPGDPVAAPTSTSQSHSAVRR